MDPFSNNDFTTNNNTTFGGYTNPIEANEPKYSYTTTNDIGLEGYFTQPNLENNNISYNTSYIPGASEVNNNEYNNYSYTFTDNINSTKNNNNNNYYNDLLSNEYISNSNYNNYGNVDNTAKSNIINFETVKPASKKNENINYTFYDNNSELLKPSSNDNYYSGNTTDFYAGVNTTNLESIPNLVSSTSNNISNINLNENNSYLVNNAISYIDYNYNYVPKISNSSHISYNSNASKNTILSKNITLKNNNIYSVNTPPIKAKERSLAGAIEINSGGLNKISSDYILKKIFNYIKDENYMHKLFIHSKKFQKKLGLNSIDFQERSINRTGIKLCNYLSGFRDIKHDPHSYYNNISKFNENKYKLNFEKESLKRDFLHHLDIFKIKYIKSYLVYYFKKYKENKKDDSNLYLDILCPFFDLLSSQEYFAELFTIPIDMKFIEYKKLENEYISTFNKLNKSKIDYSVLFKFRKITDIDFFKKYINLNKVKKLIICIKRTDVEKNPLHQDIGMNENGNYYIKSVYSKCYPNKNFEEKINLIFKTMNSFPNLSTNLTYFKINSTLYYKVKDFYLLDNLNNFKSLRYLELDHLDQMFELRSDSIRVFKTSYCKGITFSDSCSSSLKELFVYKSEIVENSKKLRFPNLEKFIFYLDDKKNSQTYYNNIAKSNLLIDFSSFYNLKDLNCEANYFLMLQNNATLEILTIFSNDFDNSKEKEKKIFEKIISMKSLKEVKISLKLLTYDDISKIPGENASVEKLEVSRDKTTQENMLINLQKKFPNINSFSFANSLSNIDDTHLQIVENKNCKINKLAIYGRCSLMKLYCLPLENLVEFVLKINTDNFNGIKDSLPFMNKNCHLTFKSLRTFKFKVCKLEFELLNNMCDNLEKMPNLKVLRLACSTEVDKAFYDKLNKKISLLKLNDIKVVISPKYSFLLERNKDKVINLFEVDGIIIKK